MNIIPEELLNIIYRSKFKSREIDRPLSGDPFDEWCGTTPGNFGDLLQRYPIRIPPIAQPSRGGGRDIKIPSFNYDNKRFSFFKIEQNFSRAVSLLEECYALKDTFKQLDKTLMEEKAQELLNMELDKLTDIELRSIGAKLMSLSLAKIATISDKEENKEITVSEHIVDFDSQIFEQKKLLIRENQLRVEKERRTVDSPYRYNEKRDRAKHKYLHRINELVQLVEAVKHGMYDVHEIMPTYPVIDDDVISNSVSEYRGRRGLEPEVLDSERGRYSVLAYKMLLRSYFESSGRFRIVSPVPLGEKYDKKYILFIQGGDIARHDHAFEQFLSESCFISDRPEEMKEFLLEARKKILDRIEILTPSLEIETDIREYLWETSVTLEKLQISSTEFIRKISVKDMFTESNSDLDKQRLADFKSTKSVAFTLTRKFFSGTDDGTDTSRFLLKGICAEVIINNDKFAKDHAFKSPPAKTKTTPEIKFVHQEYLGQPVSFEVTTPSNKHVYFDSSINIKEQSGMTNVSSSPVLYGENIVENISIFGGQWHLSFRSEVKEAAWDDVYLFLHVKRIRSNHA